MHISHEYKLTHVDWLFDGSREIESVNRLEGKYEIDSGIEFVLASDGVNPRITLQIVPIFEDGQPKLDFVVLRHV